MTAMWTVAILGFFSKVLWAHRVEAVSTAAYVCMGWMPAVAAKPMIAVRSVGLPVGNVGRRAVLHDRHALFDLRSQGSVPACRVARVRDRRKRGPLLCHHALRRRCVGESNRLAACGAFSMPPNHPGKSRVICTPLHWAKELPVYAACAIVAGRWSIGYRLKGAVLHRPPRRSARAAIR